MDSVAVLGEGSAGGGPLWLRAAALGLLTLLWLCVAAWCAAQWYILVRLWMKEQRRRVVQHFTYTCVGLLCVLRLVYCVAAAMAIARSAAATDDGNGDDDEDEDEDEDDDGRDMECVAELWIALAHELFFPLVALMMGGIPLFWLAMDRAYRLHGSILSKKSLPFWVGGMFVLLHAANIVVWAVVAQWLRCAAVHGHVSAYAMAYFRGGQHTVMALVFAYNAWSFNKYGQVTIKNASEATGGTGVKLRRLKRLSRLGTGCCISMLVLCTILATNSFLMAARHGGSGGFMSQDVAWNSCMFALVRTLELAFAATACYGIRSPNLTKLQNVVRYAPKRRRSSFFRKSSRRLSFRQPSRSTGGNGSGLGFWAGAATAANGDGQTESEGGGHVALDERESGRGSRLGRHRGILSDPGTDILRAAVEAAVAATGESAGPLPSRAPSDILHGHSSEPTSPVNIRQAERSSKRSPSVLQWLQRARTPSEKRLTAWEEFMRSTDELRRKKEAEVRKQQGEEQQQQGRAGSGAPQNLWRHRSEDHAYFQRQQQQQFQDQKPHDRRLPTDDSDRLGDVEMGLHGSRRRRSSSNNNNNNNNNNGASRAPAFNADDNMMKIVMHRQQPQPAQQVLLGGGEEPSSIASPRSQTVASTDMILHANSRREADLTGDSNPAESNAHRHQQQQRPQQRRQFPDEKEAGAVEDSVQSDAFDDLSVSHEASQEDGRNSVDGRRTSHAPRLFSGRRGSARAMSYAASVPHDDQYNHPAHSDAQQAVAGHLRVITADSAEHVSASNARGVKRSPARIWHALARLSPHHKQQPPPPSHQQQRPSPPGEGILGRILGHGGASSPRKGTDGNARRDEAVHAREQSRQFGIEHNGQHDDAPQMMANPMRRSELPDSPSAGKGSGCDGSRPHNHDRQRSRSLRILAGLGRHKNSPQQSASPADSRSVSTANNSTLGVGGSMTPKERNHSGTRSVVGSGKDRHVDRHSRAPSSARLSADVDGDWQRPSSAVAPGRGSHQQHPHRGYRPHGRHRTMSGGSSSTILPTHGRSSSGTILPAVLTAHDAARLAHARNSSSGTAHLDAGQRQSEGQGDETPRSPGGRSLRDIAHAISGGKIARQQPPAGDSGSSHPLSGSSCGVLSSPDNRSTSMEARGSQQSSSYQHMTASERRRLSRLSNTGSLRHVDGLSPEGRRNSHSSGNNSMGNSMFCGSNSTHSAHTSHSGATPHTGRGPASSVVGEPGSGAPVSVEPSLTGRSTDYSIAPFDGAPSLTVSRAASRRQSVEDSVSMAVESSLANAGRSNRASATSAGGWQGGGGVAEGSLGGVPIYEEASSPLSLGSTVGGFGQDVMAELERESEIAPQRPESACASAHRGNRLQTHLEAHSVLDAVFLDDTEGDSSMRNARPHSGHEHSAADSLSYSRGRSPSPAPDFKLALDDGTGSAASASAQAANISRAPAGCKHMVKPPSRRRKRLGSIQLGPAVGLEESTLSSAELRRGSRDRRGSGDSSTAGGSHVPFAADTRQPQPYIHTDERPSSAKRAGDRLGGDFLLDFLDCDDALQEVNALHVKDVERGRRTSGSRGGGRSRRGSQRGSWASVNSVRDTLDAMSHEPSGVGQFPEMIIADAIAEATEEYRTAAEEDNGKDAESTDGPPPALQLETALQRAERREKERSSRSSRGNQSFGPGSSFSDQSPKPPSTGRSGTSESPKSTRLVDRIRRIAGRTPRDDASASGPSVRATTTTTTTTGTTGTKKLTMTGGSGGASRSRSDQGRSSSDERRASKCSTSRKGQSSTGGSADGACASAQDDFASLPSRFSRGTSGRVGRLSEGSRAPVFVAASAMAMARRQRKQREIATGNTFRGRGDERDCSGSTLTMEPEKSATRPSDVQALRPSDLSDSEFAHLHRVGDAERGSTVERPIRLLAEGRLEDLLEEQDADDRERRHGVSAQSSREGDIPSTHSVEDVPHNPTAAEDDKLDDDNAADPHATEGRRSLADTIAGVFGRLSLARTSSLDDAADDVPAQAVAMELAKGMGAFLDMDEDEEMEFSHRWSASMDPSGIPAGSTKAAVMASTAPPTATAIGRSMSHDTAMRQPRLRVPGEGQPAHRSAVRSAEQSAVPHQPTAKTRPVLDMNAVHSGSSDSNVSECTTTAAATSASARRQAQQQQSPAADGPSGESGSGLAKLFAPSSGRDGSSTGSSKGSKSSQGGGTGTGTGTGLGTSTTAAGPRPTRQFGFTPAATATAPSFATTASTRPADPGALAPGTTTADIGGDTTIATTAASAGTSSRTEGPFDVESPATPSVSDLAKRFERRNA